MKILFIGEYSNVHATLAKGLRELGHDVTVASNGDFWKDYQRDIDLARHPGFSGTAEYFLRLYQTIPMMKGYDIVQLINPLFFELKASIHQPIYRFLRHHNKKIVLGAFGMDYYWVNECVERKQLRYSDFNFGDQLRTDPEALYYRNDWTGNAKEKLNRYIAEDCDAIIAGLYEYWTCYQPCFPEKTTFIPYPIVIREDDNTHFIAHHPIHIFIGINQARSAYKGTDIMLRAAKRIEAEYPEHVRLMVAENVPFERYHEMLNEADLLLDQLYSYTPAMNGLQAMSQGIICVGGGEPENYEILGETQLRPIINVLPNEDSVYEQLKQLIINPEHIAELKKQSKEYIRQHHDYRNVAYQYEQLYENLLSTEDK